MFIDLREEKRGEEKERERERERERETCKRETSVGSLPYSP